MTGSPSSNQSSNQSSSPRVLVDPGSESIRQVVVRAPGKVTIESAAVPVPSSGQ